MHSYKIKERKDGTVELYCDGDWLETFPDRASAEKELAARQEFDRIHSLQFR